MIQCRGSVTACPQPLVHQMRGNRVIFHSNNGGAKSCAYEFPSFEFHDLVSRADKSVVVHPVKKCVLVVGEIGNVFFE